MPAPRCCIDTRGVWSRCVPPAPHEAWHGDVFDAAPMDATPREASPPDGWPERDWQVLLELARGDDARVGFQGLKRRLDLHPEMLRRSLARLVEVGAVEKSEGGYRLTDSGHTHAAGAEVPRGVGPLLPVAALLVPSEVPVHAIVERFAGRWFDGLFWYGVEPAAAETALTWLADGGTVVRLRIGMGVMRVEVAGPDAPDARVRAAAPLVAAVAAWLRAAHDPGDDARGMAS